MLERYLHDFDRELSRRLPREDVQARLVEAEDHLRQGIEARLELGLDPLAAEREALVAFGRPRRIARRTDVRAHRLGLLAIFGTMGLATLLGSTSLYFIGWLVLPAILGYARAAFRSGRPSRASLALAIVLAAWLPTTYVMGLKDEGFGRVNRTLLVDAPRAVLPVFSSGIDTLYERRFEAFFLLGVTFGVDLFFSGLGAFVRRRRGGVRA